MLHSHAAMTSLPLVCVCINQVSHFKMLTAIMVVHMCIVDARQVYHVRTSAYQHTFIQHSTVQCACHKIGALELSLKKKLVLFATASR